VKHFVSLQFLNLRESVRLLGRGISPTQGRYLLKHRINTDKHSCLEWDLNPRSQLSSRRKYFTPYTARPLWSAILIIFVLSLWNFIIINEALIRIRKVGVAAAYRRSICLVDWQIPWIRVFSIMTVHLLTQNRKLDLLNTKYRDVRRKVGSAEVFEVSVSCSKEIPE
jgi:hypothetical protein